MHYHFLSAHYITINFILFREGDTNYLIRKYSPLRPSKIKKYGRNYKKILRLYLKNLKEDLWIKVSTTVVYISTIAKVLRTISKI